MRLVSKRFLIFILFSCFIISFIKLKVFAETYYHNISIICDGDVNLSGIKFEIAHLSHDYKESKERRFIISDDSGQFNFAVKDPIIKLTIDLDSVPIGYGVDRKCIYLDEYDTDAIVGLYLIDTCYSKLINNNVVTKFMSYSGIELFVDHENNIKYDFDSSMLCNLDNLEYIPYTIYVDTNYDVFEFADSIDLRDMDSGQKIDYLKKINVISENEYDDIISLNDLFANYQYNIQSVYVHNNRFMMAK